MPDPGDRLPLAVRQLLDRLDSIAQLELLLLLQRTAPDEWTAEQLAAELRIEPAWALEQLALLGARQLLAESEPGSGRYRFDPATPALAKSVEALASCYSELRVTVVGVLYSRPVDRIRVFADAFRIRREDDDG
ncbi:MAG TPA: hypothetical protein VLC53_08250 [Myxococcota bacterium]|jgi:hypothetical protein|nr:hypothetical protein [Myxococcota bacterium]